MLKGTEGKLLYDELIKREKSLQEKILKIEKFKKDAKIKEEKILEESKITMFKKSHHHMQNDEDFGSSNLRASETFDHVSKSLQDEIALLLLEEVKPESLILSKLYEIITKTILLNFNAQFHSIYIALINVMKNFIKEKEFRNILFSTCLDSMVNWVLLNEKNMAAPILASFSKIKI